MARIILSYTVHERVIISRAIAKYSWFRHRILNIIYVVTRSIFILDMTCSNLWISL